MMISSPLFSPLALFLGVLLFPPPLLLPYSSSFPFCTASPAGIEAILDPLGDLVQVAPSLALHQEQAEASAAQANIKSIKTPSGTVKCSCQPVSAENEDASAAAPEDDFPSDPTKTIEIEIYKPSDSDSEDEVDEEEGGGEEEEEVESNENDRGDTPVKDVFEGESQKEIEKKPLPVLRNSFSLDGDDTPFVSADAAVDSVTGTSEDRLFNTEEPHSFLSFLSSLVSQSAKAQSQSERGSQPENIMESEAEQESDKILHDDDEDDLADLKGDGNVVNHRVFDTVTASASSPSSSSSSSKRKTVYKSFRTADLIGAQTVIPPSFEDNSEIKVAAENTEKMESVGGSGNLRDNFFLWDFIYASPEKTGKKNELLKMGTVTQPFQGPRRRRRRRRSLRGNGNNPPVFYVYPVGQQPASSPQTYENEVIIPENKTKPEVPQKLQMRSDAVQQAVLDKEEIHQAMQAAMDNAWQQYGPKGLDAPPVTPAPPTQVYVIPASEQPPVPPLPGQQPIKSKSSPPPKRPPQNPEQQQLVFYTPPRPFLFIDRIFNPFQPMTSEWDKHITTFEGPPPPPPEPGFFSRFMASYIDFEVNNHEAADLMRKVVFGIFVGFLIAGWIALGAALGIVPFKKLLAYVVGTHYDGVNFGNKRNDKGKEFAIRDTTLSEITDKILLSLDADWLKRLEERVLSSDAGGGTSGSKIPTQVFCCILPDAHTNGRAECQVTKGVGGGGGKKKFSTFKCISDLIYNFHFGPPEDDDADVELDNFVNIKSKANSKTDVKGEENEVS